jgi:hypothetical protein
MENLSPKEQIVEKPRNGKWKSHIIIYARKWKSSTLSQGDGRERKIDLTPALLIGQF